MQRIALVTLALWTSGCGRPEPAVEQRAIRLSPELRSMLPRLAEQAQEQSRMLRPLDLSRPTVIGYTPLVSYDPLTFDSARAAFYREFRDSVASLEPLFQAHGFRLQVTLRSPVFVDSSRHLVHALPYPQPEVGLILYTPGYAPRVVAGFQHLDTIRGAFEAYARLTCSGIGPAPRSCLPPSAS
jgi:hypothetical protein